MVGTKITVLQAFHPFLGRAHSCQSSTPLQHILPGRSFSNVTPNTPLQVCNPSQDLPLASIALTRPLFPLMWLPLVLVPRHLAQRPCQPKHLEIRAVQQRGPSAFASWCAIQNGEINESGSPYAIATPVPQAIKISGSCRIKAGNVQSL